jgi:hypothetical protein
MKTIAPPFAELLAQLHDHGADVVKLIEAIPALKGDDLPQIVNRVQMLGKLKELEANSPAEKPPSDDHLRIRIRLLQADRQAQNNDCLDYEFRGMSNKALATALNCSARSSPTSFTLDRGRNRRCHRGASRRTSATQA